jgi:hypothetical protein
LGALIWFPGTGLGAPPPSPPVSSPPPRPSQSSFQSGVSYTLELNRPVYQSREPVEIEFSLANHTGGDCIFSSPRHPGAPCFTVMQGKKLVWSWPSLAERRQIPRQEWLGKGLTKIYRLSWLQVDGAEKPVPAGRYSLVATFPSQEETGHSGVIKLMADFTIGAKASSQDWNPPGLRAILLTDKTTYSSGEPVRIQLALKNEGKDPLAFGGGTSQRYDFVVRSEGKEIWRWSQGRLFAQMLISWKLPPGASVAYTAAWLQKDNGGKPVPPGRYQIEGLQIGGGQAAGEITVK